MKTEKNIFIAFILNISFSIMELFGGIITNSVAIISDSIHDFGDAVSIGLSWLLEKISKREVDNKYTYGYIRYSILGAVITNIILIIGSVLVIYNAIIRIINPVTIDYDGMIIFAIFGFIINLIAALVTKDGGSLNQKAVNLHMLEDVLGWIVVLIGSIIMKFTDIKIIDPIMSIGVAIYLLFHACKNIKEILDLFLEKIPNNISIEEIKKHILEIDGVSNVHHIHIWSMDGYHNYATMHVVVDKIDKKTKDMIREELYEHSIEHVTLELELENENCQSDKCKITEHELTHHHHH